MIGKLRFAPLISLMSLIHVLWLSIVFAESPMSLTPRLVNSGSSLANAPSSVVQTGVKSSGWEKSTTQLSPMNLWKLMGPWVVSASKSGAV